MICMAPTLNIAISVETSKEVDTFDVHVLSLLLLAAPSPLYITGCNTSSVIDSIIKCRLQASSNVSYSFH